MQENAKRFQYTVVAEVLQERERQDKKWGEQNHQPIEWLAILAEEFGEVSEAVNSLHFGGTLKLKDGTVLTTVAEVTKHYMAELTQVAAVAQAMVECELRRKAREAVTRVTDEWDVISKPSSDLGPRVFGVKKGGFGACVAIPDLYYREYNPANIISALKEYVEKNPNLCMVNGDNLHGVDLLELMPRLQGVGL